MFKEGSEYTLTHHTIWMVVTATMAFGAQHSWQTPQKNTQWQEFPPTFPNHTQETPLSNNQQEQVVECTRKKAFFFNSKQPTFTPLKLSRIRHYSLLSLSTQISWLSWYNLFYIFFFNLIFHTVVDYVCASPIDCVCLVGC